VTGLTNLKAPDAGGFPFPNLRIVDHSETTPFVDRRAFTGLVSVRSDPEDPSQCDLPCEIAMQTDKCPLRCLAVARCA
jgi:hypothetical protein